MILSVSRRTDIPWHYSGWFFNRIREGYALVRNPFNVHQVSRISLSPKEVDCMVFWTKNPIPMMEEGLGVLEPYPYYVQFTLTSYGRDVEPNLPDKRQVLIPAFRRLSASLGAHRVIWRFDPVFLSGRYTLSYQLHAFEEIAAALEGCTERVVISFLDMYRGIKTAMNQLGMIPMSQEMMEELAGEMGKMGARHGMRVESCAEAIDLEKFGIHRGACIDGCLIERLTGRPAAGKKDKNQRPECGCVESVDIGSYGTCPGGCRYCYAGPFRGIGSGPSHRGGGAEGAGGPEIGSEPSHRDGAARGSAAWSWDSPILGRPIGEGDVIRERKKRREKAV